jgi:hypothetical protein
MANERTKMNKPDKTTFISVVAAYVKTDSPEVRNWAINQVDDWTHYYKSKFWGAVQEMRTN